MQKKIKKELLEWGILLGVLGVLWVTGWYRDVAGFIQRGLLETRLYTPTTAMDERPADYDFQLVNAGGKTVPFEEFRGKTVFVNLWATWCPPCIAEMPDIQQLYDTMGEDVTFIMISLDKEPATALQFVEKRRFTFPIYFPKYGLPVSYNSSSIPTTFILSPDGKIVSEHRGMAKYNTSGFRKFLLGLAERQPAPADTTRHTYSE